MPRSNLNYKVKIYGVQTEQPNTGQVTGIINQNIGGGGGGGIGGLDLTFTEGAKANVHELLSKGTMISKVIKLMNLDEQVS